MSPQLSVFLNSFCFMIMGMVSIVVIMDVLFPRRHTLHVFIGYTLVKGLLWSWYDVAYFLDAVGPAEYAFQMLGPVFFGVLSYIVLYYTWDGSFAKIGLGSFCLDTAFSIIAMAMLFLAHEWFGTASAIDNRGYFGAGTVFCCTACLALVFMLPRLLDPAVSWFRNHELVHGKAWLFIVLSGIIASTISRMLSVEQVQMPATLASLTLVLLIACFAVFVVSQIRLEWKRKKFLADEVELASTYDRSVREQVAYLQESSVQLDRMAADAARLQTEVDNPLLEDRVLQLRDTCDALRRGSYSNCPALDVVLSVSGEALERLGYRVEYRVSPLGDAAVQAALVAQAMLTWVEQVCATGAVKPLAGALPGRQHANGGGGPLENAASGSDAGDGDACTPDIALRIIGCNGQLAFVLKMPSSKVRFPKRLIKDRVLEFDGMLLESDDGVCKTVRVLIAESV